MLPYPVIRQLITVLRNQVVFAIGLLVVCLVASTTHAHFIWVKRDGEGPARAYFGEWANDIREKSGERLDMVKSLQAFGSSPTQPLPQERRSDHIEIVSGSATDVRVIEAGFAPREDKQHGGKSKTVFYAKAGRAETAAVLDFELVQTTANGNTFVLYFRGAPFAKSEVTVFGPPKWEKSLRTDEQGKVTVPLPWAGRYILHATFTEHVTETAEKNAFDSLRYVTTLSFINTDGLPWPADL